MCRGFQQNERERLKIRAFYTQLSISCIKNKTTLPDFFTLNFLPRINGSLLEVNGSSIRSDSPAFITLHRVLSNERSKAVMIYGCRERVIVSEGVRFEIYAGDLKLLKGIFRKGEGQNWNMECKCEDVVEGVKYAEVSAAADGQVAPVMSERVEMVAGQRRRRRSRCGELEEIPEVREEGELGSDVCCCCECGGWEEGMDGGDGEMEMVEVEGVRWAVDVGIWVVCIGVGYLVSRASSSKRSRRKGLI
ncbi:hypothetical protein ACJIZ3_009638 [Penstemon smallii]|uniref:Uncharacterized protein n=1 Tax=Penstemon smallii TaxID=265156 RepID=A0ABD3TD28_9LAMI